MKKQMCQSSALPCNELILNQFLGGQLSHVNLYFQHFVIFIISLFHMKDAKENAKQSMIKMYNVSDFYEIIDKVGRGTYGTVYKAKGLKDGRFYAIKKLQNNDSKLQQEGFPITALREITLLKQIDHPNIIKLKEIIVSRPNKRNLFRGSTFLVFEYMDHDFAGLFKMKSKFSLPQIKCIIRQLLEGVCYLHRNKILHRDIKSANILLNDEGDVKLADFGLGRKIRFQNMFTYKVVTLWYRAPQLLLGSKTYTDKIDVWSVGCVVAQFFTGEVLFKKQTQFAQMERIYEIVGDFQTNDMKINEQSYKIYQNLQDLRPRKSYPKEIANYFKKNCPNISDVSIDFIDRLLRLDPNKRMSCEEALRHPFFNEKPLACNKNQIQKMQYQCHEMFKDRSIKIQRSLKNDDEHQNRNRFKENRENREPRDVVRQNKEHKERARELEERKYPRNYRNDKEKQYRQRDPKNRPSRFQYVSRKNQKYHSSEEKSSYERNSDSYSSSSRSSQYSSSSRSRSRHNDRRIKEQDRRSRDEYKSRQHYMRRDQKRRPQRKEERRSVQKFERDRKEDFQRKDKYYKNERDERFSGHKDYRRKDQRVQGKRYDREQRVVFKKDEKPQERRDDYKDDKRPFEREVREKREQWKRDSKQRKYQKYQKGYQPKGGRYNDERDYKRRQQKWVQKTVKEEEKYQDNQKYGEYYRKNDGTQKRDNKYFFVSSKDPYRKKDYRNSSSSQRSSNHRYKKEKDYRKPYNYQRKNHYKKSHSDSNDHRNH